MTAEPIALIKTLIGELHIQIAVLQAENQGLREQLVKLPEVPHAP